MAVYNPLDWPGYGVDAANSLSSGVGGALNAVNPFATPKSKYDAEKYLLQGTQNAQDIYDAAMGQFGGQGPQVRDVVAPTIAGPKGEITAQQIGTGRITARDVNAPSIVTGQAGQDLRNQTLSQIEAARTAPSASQGMFRAGLGATSSAALAQAGAARGADRASARRDAMLATQMGGMQASGQAAALAAQEQSAREQAATQGLLGLRAGDVAGGQVELGAQLANQQAGLQAQTATQQFALGAGQANQGAALQAQQANAQRQLAYDTLRSGQQLTAQQANQGADLNAYNLGQQANLGYLNAATGAQGAYTGATGVAANYATGRDQAAAQQKAANVNLISSGLGLLSDINAKQDVGTFADGYNKQLTDAYGMRPAPDPYAGIDPFDPGGRLAGVSPSQRIIQPAFDTSSNIEAAKAAGSTISGSAQTESATNKNTAAGLATAGLGLMGILSDERAKSEMYRLGQLSMIRPSEQRRVTRQELPPEQSMAEIQRSEIQKTIPAGISAGMPPAREPSLAVDLKRNMLGAIDMDPYKYLGRAQSTERNRLSPAAPGMDPDEFAKQQVQRMDDQDRIDWARRVEPITYRYKPGITDEDDGGARAGVSAQQLEGTGPLGELMVHRDPYSGLRKVDGLALGLMMGKAALDRADEAVSLAKGKAKKGGR